ncbi:glycosyltransferase, partial [Dermacoccus sp. CCH2-D9]
FVGRIQPLKAPDVLVRAVARMIEDAPWRREKLRLVIVGGPSGSGLDKPLALQALARELGVKDVVDFVPPVSRRELVTWFHATDVVAVPSHSESFGLVAIEASASGTPVVAAAVGGLPTAVGDGGVLVDGHDPAAWAQELAALLDDPPRIDELGRRAARHAQDYSWDASVDKLLAVYEDACRRETSSYIDASRALAGVPSAIVP